MKTRLGIISDTHEYFDPQIPELFGQVDMILHAGDVGAREVIHQLSAIAPVFAVRGNVDGSGPCSHLPESLLCTVDGVSALVTHIFEPPAADAPGGDPRGAQLVFFGHSHEPHLDRRAGVLYFNPGSSSRPQAGQSRSVGLVEIEDGKVLARHLPLP